MDTRRVFNLLHKKQTALERSSVPNRRDCFLFMDIFHDLTPEDIATIDHSDPDADLSQGQIIYAQEEQAERLFLLKRGRVYIYRLTSSGKRLALEIIEPGTFFGEMPLLGQTLRNAYAEAAVDSALCVMSRADIERMIREWPEVAFRIIEVLGQRLTLYQARLEEFAYRSVPARLATVLLRMGCERQHGVVTLTHQELGDMVGATRETVTKTLDELQRAGVVELSRGHIILRNIEDLRAWLEE